MSYVLTDLGPHQHYSYDPKFRGTTIYSVQDRATGGRFDTIAAFWDGAWSLLPDPIPGKLRVVAEDGIAGRIVGHVTLDPPENHGRAVIWELNGGTWATATLPMPTGALSANATAISEDGKTVVGQVALALGDSAAILWREMAGVWGYELLPKPGAVGYAVGFDGTTGDVIGNVHTGAVWQAVRWRHGGSGWSLTALALPGHPGPPIPGASTAVESFRGGVAVGAASSVEQTTTAVRWMSNGSIEDLGAGNHSYAYGHFGGTVVGTAEQGNFDTGFVWSQAGGVQDIHPTGWDWSLPSGVDVNGRIVGTMGTGAMTDPAGLRRLFLLTPTP